jgi:hypothetical protein
MCDMQSVIMRTMLTSCVQAQMGEQMMQKMAGGAGAGSRGGGGGGFGRNNYV